MKTKEKSWPDALVSLTEQYVYQIQSDFRKPYGLKFKGVCIPLQTHEARTIWLYGAPTPVFLQKSVNIVIPLTD